ncbi:hypothetical protein BJ165DRAFT_1534981 [Panaeolus papilionaceus]|nr:hypothetical protein BJ165DRAFT_1534981 [Panaeolus papilionaceus]
MTSFTVKPTGSSHTTRSKSSSAPTPALDELSLVSNRPLDPGDDMYHGKPSMWVVTDLNASTSLPRPRRRTRSCTAHSDVDQGQTSCNVKRNRLAVEHSASKADPELDTNIIESFVVTEAVADDDSELSDLDDSKMDEDNIGFIDDGPLPPDPEGLHTQKVPYSDPVSTTSTDTVVIANPTGYSPEPSLRGQSMPSSVPSSVPSSKPYVISFFLCVTLKSHVLPSLSSPFPGGLDVALPNDFIQTALQNKDFLMGLLQMSNSNQPSPSPSHSQGNAWSTAVRHFSAHPPSPLPTIHSLSPAAMSQVASSTTASPSTPTKAGRKPSQKKKGKAKAVACSNKSALAPTTPQVVVTTPASQSPTKPNLSSSGLPTPNTPGVIGRNAHGPVILPANTSNASASAGASPVVSEVVPPTIPSGPTPSPAITGVQATVSSTLMPMMSMKDLAHLIPAGFNIDEPNTAPSNRKSLRLCPPLPSACKVNDLKLHDPLLAETYTGLANLKKGRFSSWSSNMGWGQVVFSTWVTKTPDMN